MRGHPTDYDVERNKKSLRQRLLQQFVDDFRIRLATHSLHCLTNEKAEERFLAAAILLNFFGIGGQHIGDDLFDRSEEHTSELQSLMRNSYAVICLKTKKKKHSGK